MIDEKKLIEDFKNTFSDSVLNQTFGFGKYTLLEAVEEIINRQPQVETDTNVGSKWIPCEERLPKKHDDYIVTYKEIRGEKVKYYTSYAWYEPQTKE